MASKQSDPYTELLAAYFAFAFFVLLVVLVSPFFLAGVALVVAYRVFRAYQNSPARLARIAHQKSIALYDEARRLAERRSFPTPREFTDALFERLAETELTKLPDLEVLTSLFALAEVLYEAEGFTIDTIPPPPPEPSLIADSRYQDLLTPHIAKVSHPDALTLCQDAIAASVMAFVKRLPAIAIAPADSSNRPPLFKVRLLDVAGHAGHMVEQLVLPLYTEEIKKVGLFSGLRQQIDQNLWSVSGVTSKDAAPSKLLWPPDHRGTPDEIVSAYLRHTPFEYLFAAELPFDIPQQSRMEHWHLVAGSGHGKTQTLQHIILRDLQAEDPPALIIVDSQGDMLLKIQRLALFEDSDRLVIIDPEDDHSPALNMFDVKTARLQGYSRAVREQVEAGIIELFNYVFGALASELTAKQGTAFAYITRLMLAIPGATIHTFRELMETTDQSAFAEHIERLDPTARAFFQNQFFNRSAFGETRQQIARRLYTVLQVPAFERMFASPVNKLDMFAVMQERKVVLVNTSKALLKTDASALFGRYMIALTLNAAFERVAVLESQRIPAYLVIDEAAEYFDETLERLLAQARKFKLGVLFAHQHMDQLSPTLRSAVAANKSIKMAGGVSDHDARLLSADMRTTTEFVASSRKHDRSTDFVCYVRNIVDASVRVSVPFGSLEGSPRMSRQAHHDLLALNHARYAVGPAQTDGSPEPPPVSLNRPDLPWKLDKNNKRSRRNPDDIDMRASET